MSARTFCSGCGYELPHRDVPCSRCTPQVSDPDDKLDSMIEQAAVPSLATLFRKAKQSGAIKPVTGYGATPSTN